MKAPAPSRRAQRGQSLIEYSLIVAFTVVVLIANPDAIPALIKALGDAYSAFVYAISLSWI